MKAQNKQALPSRSSDAEAITTGMVTMSSQDLPQSLKQGNRQVITDHYVSANVQDEPSSFNHKVFVRLGASKKTVFTKVSFQHSIFDNCYLTYCSFDSCDFTGCRFVGSNFHQTSFAGCNFKYAVFERTQIDDDILNSEAPIEENLRMRFARSLRMNYSQLGDAKAVNKAISLELEATAIYLLNSWKSEATYYKNKYGGVKRFRQFWHWAEFWILDFVWGNGESILKLLRTLLIAVVAIAIYDAAVFANPLNLGDYWTSLSSAPGIFLGAVSKQYPTWVLSTIATCRFIGVALLTALLVKRFGRR